MVAGGDGGRLPGRSEALQRGRLHVDDEGLQLVSPHRLDGLERTQMLPLASTLFRKGYRDNASGRAHARLDVEDTDLPAAQDVSDGLDAGAVQISVVLATFQKPAGSASRLGRRGEARTRPLTCRGASCCQRSLCW